MLDKVLYFIFKLIFKFIIFCVKKYFLKNLVMVILDLINYKYFLQEYCRLLDIKKINDVSFIDRVSLSIVKNIERLFMVNINEMLVFCLVFEINGERISEDLVQYIFDSNILKYEGFFEMLFEFLQKGVLFFKIELYRKIKVQKGI